MRKLFLGTIFLFSVATTQGCVPLLIGAAAGAGGIAYIKGTLEKNFDKPVDEMHRAGLSGLKSLDMTISEDKTTQHEALIAAKDKENKKITVKIEALTEKASKIRIRVGVFGDQEKSLMVLNAIQRKM